MSEKRFGLDVVSVELKRERELLSEEPVNTPDRAVLILQGFLEDKDREYVCAVYCDSKLKPICMSVISIGTLNCAVFHPREVMKAAILANADSVMLFHNHPSGDPGPSEEDARVTNRLIEAGKALGIEVLDHIIVGHGCRYSFQENGLISERETGECFAAEKSGKAGIEEQDGMGKQSPLQGGISGL